MTHSLANDYNFQSTLNNNSLLLSTSSSSSNTSYFFYYRLNNFRANYVMDEDSHTIYSYFEFEISHTTTTIDLQ